MMRRIPVAAPDLSGNEERYVVEAIRSSWIASTGAYVDRFERQFAELIGSRACVSVVNGTAALHLAVLANGAGSGDEVLVPSLTYIATANAVRYTGAEPVFIDVDSETWCIDPALIESHITPRTKGIVAVHLYGHPADMDAILEIAGRHGLWVIEDAAEAHGARYKGRPVGGLASIGMFSFYGNKILTSGEGGALTTNDPELEQRMRLLRGQGMDPERRYFFPIVGYNYRLTNIACAILCAQLERFDELRRGRQRAYDWYRERLSGVRGIGFQPVADWAEPAPWLFCITVDEQQYGCSRDELMAALDRSSIETRPFFQPLHQLPPYEAQSSDRGDDLPVTQRLGTSGMNLPTFSGLTESDIDRITSVIRRAGPRE